MANDFTKLGKKLVSDTLADKLESRKEENYAEMTDEAKWLESLQTHHAASLDAENEFFEELVKRI